MRMLSLWTLACLVGCSEGAFTAYKADETADAGGTQEQDETADTGHDGSNVDIAVWWSLGADLEVVNGAVVASASTITVSLFGTDDEEICQATGPVASVTDIDKTPHSTVLTWWKVGFLQWEDACVDLQRDLHLDEPLELGVGLMHDEIRAVVSTVEEAEPGAAETLNAAYASLDGGDTILVYGTAGLPGAYAGEDAAANQPPLENGRWSLIPVYRFSL